MATRSPTCLARITPNHKFYIPGGDLYIMAQKQLFRVHRYFFVRESARFRDELATPATRGGHARGKSKSDPIPLAVRATDLEKFLWVFYLPTYNLYNALADDWIIILTLAHEWGFGEVKNLALRQLEEKDFPVVDRIILYNAHDTGEEYLQRYYVDLCLRPEPLTLQEGRRLGMEIVVMVAAIREHLCFISNEGQGGTPPRAPNRRDAERAVARFAPEPHRESGDLGDADRFKGKSIQLNFGGDQDSNHVSWSRRKTGQKAAIASAPWQRWLALIRPTWLISWWFPRLSRRRGIRVAPQNVSDLYY